MIRRWSRPWCLRSSAMSPRLSICGARRHRTPNSVASTFAPVTRSSCGTSPVTATPRQSTIPTISSLTGRGRGSTCRSASGFIAVSATGSPNCSCASCGRNYCRAIPPSKFWRRRAAPIRTSSMACARCRCVSQPEPHSERSRRGKGGAALLAVRGEPLLHLGSRKAEKFESQRGIEGRSHRAQPVVQCVFGPADRTLRALSQTGSNLHCFCVELGILDGKRNEPNTLGFFAEHLVAQQQVIFGLGEATKQRPDDC